MRPWVVLGVICLLAACSKGAAPPDASAQASAQASQAAASNGPAAAQSGAPAPANPASAPMLAYSYDYGIEAPPSKVRSLMAAHQAACVAAGPAACQVTGAETSEDGRDQISAKLQLRATPAWLHGYEDKLSHDADAAGGRLTKSETTTEDLTRDIVDADAAVKAKTALRDRLQAVLESRPGDVADLIKVEEELATVQGDLDATTSNLAVMRERVATSDVTIEYQSAGVFAPQGVWAPVGKAFSGVSTILAASLAALIDAIAAVAPWALVIGFGVWLGRRWARTKRAKAKPTPSEPPRKD